MPAERIERRCADCPIRFQAVCARCEPDELALLEQMKSYITVEPGATPFRAGDPLRHVATVVAGAATLSRTLEDGRRQVTGLLLPGDFIGRPWRETHQFDLTAAEPLLLCRFERPAFETMMVQTPNVAERLLARTLDDLDAARDWSVVLGRMAARERVAAFLLSLARRIGRQATAAGAVSFQMPLTREAMADHLGLTLETASRQMSGLRRDGIVRTEGRSLVVVPDMERLAEAAQDDDDGAALD